MNSITCKPRSSSKSEHALDVGLRDRDDVADHQRQHGQNRDHGRPRCRAVWAMPRPVHQDAHHQRQRASFGAEADVQRDRRASTLVDVRQPHVERHGAELEGDTDDQEREPEPQRQVVQDGSAAAPAAISSNLSVPVTP